MNIKFLLFLVVIASGLGTFTSAKTNGKKKPVANVKLLEAFTQRTVPGIPGGQIKTAYHFIIIWEGAKYPETFFWRGDNGWLTCNMVKARKIKNKDNHAPEGQDYTTEFVTGGNIHKGDTLELTPIIGGKFPVPAEVTADIKNTLFYKTGGSGWLSFPIKSISKKADIVMQ